MSLGGGPIPGSFGTTGRGPRLLSGGGRRATAISTASTLVVLAGLAAIFLLAPGSAEVRHTFFNPADMWQSFIGNPKKGYYSVGEALWLNIRMFIAAEILILIVALVIALIRLSTSAVVFPFRVLSMIYVDFFRGVPLLLIILAIGFGVPALRLPFVSSQPAAVYGVVALVLSYSAYVSEVYRAGLNSVHQSQVAAARSLGLSQATTLRHVVLPQAVRNVIPPLLNDFISLQKDTALVGVLGAIEANEAAQIYSQHRVQLLQLHRGRDPVPDPDHPAGPVHRPRDRPRPPAAPGRGARRDRRRRRPGPPRARRSGSRACASRSATNEVLKGIDLSVATHEVICLIGASGSGKSTLLRCLNLLEPIDAGRISLWGQEITGAGDEPEPGPPVHRDRVPVVQPVPAHERAAQHHAGADQGARRAPGPGRGTRPARCWTGSAWRTGRPTTRTGCPAASSSASRSSARWPCSRRSCCSTR